MLDFIALSMAKHVTDERVREALVNSPVYREEDFIRITGPRDGLRSRVSGGLRWLADRLEPASEGGAASTACP